MFDALHSDFPGYGRDRAQCDQLLTQLWTPAQLKGEVKLFREKWWDYRHLHPLVATDLFGHVFTIELRRLIREHINPAPPKVMPDGRVLDWNPLGLNIFIKPLSASREKLWRRKLNGLIKARQIADADGIPYQVFIRVGLRHLYFGPGGYLMEHVKLPTPLLLYGETCLQAARIAWFETMQAGVITAQSPRFQLPGDGTQDYAAHQAWLLSQVERRSMPRFSAKRLMEQGFITQHQATKYLPAPIPA